MPTAPTSPVTPAVERTWVEFSPTSRFSFIETGGPGVPDIAEERSLRGDGPPLHRHPWDTWELVISGTLRVVVDGHTFEAGPGATIHVPAGAAHTYIVTSDEAHLVSINDSDGRFPRLQQEVGPMFLAEGGPDLAAIGAAAAALDVELLGPPLTLD